MAVVGDGDGDVCGGVFGGEVNSPSPSWWACCMELASASSVARTRSSTAAWGSPVVCAQLTRRQRMALMAAISAGIRTHHPRAGLLSGRSSFPAGTVTDTPQRRGLISQNPSWLIQRTLRPMSWITKTRCARAGTHRPDDDLSPARRFYAVQGPHVAGKTSPGGQAAPAGPIPTGG